MLTSSGLGLRKSSTKAGVMTFSNMIGENVNCCRFLGCSFWVCVGKGGG